MQPGHYSRAKPLEALDTPHQKTMMRREAELEGWSVRDLAVSSSQDVARGMVAANEVIALGAADSRAFVDALLAPLPSPERMLDTVRRYREITGI